MLSPSPLSRLQLQDRIRIAPLDVTSGTFLTHFPWGGVLRAGLWVDEASAELGAAS